MRGCVALTVALCVSCGAWDESAPAPTPSPACPALQDAISVLDAHLASGATSHVATWLSASTPHLRSLVTALDDLALNLAEAPTLTTTTSADAIWRALMPLADSVTATEADSLAEANLCAEVIHALSACLTDETLALGETLLEDPRGPERLNRLLQAAARPAADKATTLQPLGLDEQTAFIGLAGGLLKSLANPDSDATNLLQLLEGLRGSQPEPQSLIVALADVMLLMMTDSSGALSQPRRALTGATLACLDERGRKELAPWLLYRLLVRLDVEAPETPPALPNTLPLGAARLSPALVPLRACLDLGFQAPTGGPLVLELKALSTGPVATALETILGVLSGQRGCEVDRG